MEYFHLQLVHMQVHPLWQVIPLQVFFFNYLRSSSPGSSPGFGADTKFDYVVCFQETNFSPKDITWSLEIAP